MFRDVLNLKSREYHAKNRVKRNQNYKVWASKNKEHLIKKRKEYWLKNKEKISKSYRNWRLKNMQKRRDFCKKWRLEHPESVKKSFKKWSRNNKELLRSWQKEYACKNRIRIKTYMRSYHKNVYYPLNKSRILIRTKSYKASHPVPKEIRRRQAAEWRKNNPEKLRALGSKRQARRRGAEIGDRHVDSIIKELRSKDSFTCYYCQNKFIISKMHIDHIIPIVKGGRHSSDNICSSCSTCNCRKNKNNVGDIKFIPQSFLSL